eukprot:TRINITY_DN504_c0_g1_i5.p1 TRINITY_DN504_c0_g1~~TRINITY_DN504_c0_g1_i5.p1  ORF type:complete len:162 (-),score=11.63 TRINITY_DN504_c0_g1_i5:352-837(-)
MIKYTTYKRGGDVVEAHGDSASSNSDRNSGPEAPASTSKRVECHCCCALHPESYVIKCLRPGCPLSYCRGCLIKYHKFSRKIARRLPSPAWNCPHCLHKCRCQKCISKTERKSIQANAKRSRGLRLKEEVKSLVEEKKQILSGEKNDNLQFHPCSHKTQVL